MSATPSTFAPVRLRRRADLEAAHLVVGARGRLRLVLDDADRRALLAGVRDALKSALLAYCLMDTHLHVVAEGPGAHFLRWLDGAIRTHLARFRRRHGPETPIELRGPVAAFPVTHPEELARTLRYDHENPVATAHPLCARPVEYPWSSAREYAGLAAAPIANVAAALERLGPAASRRLAERYPLADLTPARTPVASPDVLLAAIAQALGLDPSAIASPARGSALVAARAAYIRLGELEAYGHGQLAPALGRTRSMASRLGAASVPEHTVRVARTLVREAAFRRWLRPPSPEGAGDSPEW